MLISLIVISQLLLNPVQLTANQSSPDDCEHRWKIVHECFRDLLFRSSAPPTSVQELDQNYCSLLDEKLAYIASFRECSKREKFLFFSHRND